MSGCKCFDLFLKLAAAEGNRGAGRDVQRRIEMKSDTLENGAEDRRLRNIEISVIILHLRRSAKKRADSVIVFI